MKVMKIINLIIGIACLLGACHSNRMRIEGEIGDIKENKIYLGEITNTYYGLFDPIDSAEIEEGKFTFTVDCAKKQMLFLGFRPGQGGMVFAEAGNLKVKPATVKKGGVVWEVSGSVLNDKYRDFMKACAVVRNDRLLDSLDALFFTARDREDREEMARIKEESMPYYEQAQMAEDQLVRQTVDGNMENPFGIYLYYSKLFGRKDFSTKENIGAEREYQKNFGPEAQQTPYIALMNAQLDRYAGCTIGAVAPEITGRDTLGNPIKLSDFRGKYVIVDFWDSYCHWCREETPWLRKALEAFKGKNFTILGVSDDRKKELWLAAIKEDHSNWDHLLLPPKTDIFTTYCIKGIPHIILVGPDGKILAKEMRHEELTDVPANFIK